MSTLGTFAEFGVLQDVGEALKRGKRFITKNVPEAAKKAVTKGGALVKSETGSLTTTSAEKSGALALRDSAMKSATPTNSSLAVRSQQNVDTATPKKKSNLGLYLGLGGAAAAGGVTALALSGGKKEKKEADMSYNSTLRTFAEESDPFVIKTKAGADAAKKGIRDKEKQYYAESYGKADGVGKEALKKQSGKYLRQRNIENIVDSKGGIKDAYSKGGIKDVVRTTLAVSGKPERAAINAGKNSKSKIVRDIASGAEELGRKGFRAGATGGRGLVNKLVGRTVTGKVARLGAAGAGIAAVGSALKRKEKEEQ